MAPNKYAKCSDCLKKITNREFLACNLCNNAYHIHSRAKVWNHLHEVVSTRSCVLTNLLVTKKVAPF